MILIADSGSTKTDWSLVSSGKVIWQGKSKGLNPYFLSENEMDLEIRNVLSPLLENYRPESAFFYGAGCIFGKAEIVRSLLRKCLNIEKVTVHSDLMAAVHCLCGDRPGIACILGTGSNACFYDGTQITKHISPLGFILGDEGSGAVLGKLLVGSLLKGVLGNQLREKFILQYGYSEEEIIDRVYRQPFPNRFLASFTPFIKENIHESLMHKLVLDSFIAFFSRNVLPLECEEYEVNMVGSIAYHFKDILEEAAAKCNMKLGRIVQSPMEGLIDYLSL